MAGQRRRVRRRISIHALREEGDLLLQRILHGPVISIHALREEGDALYTLEQFRILDFYPRPPRGGRHRLPGEYRPR